MNNNQNKYVLGFSAWIDIAAESVGDVQRIAEELEDAVAQLAIGVSVVDVEVGKNVTVNLLTYH